MHETALDKKSEAALLLARGMATDAVGKAVERDGSTVRRWRQDPAFQDEVIRLRGELLGQTAGALAAAAGEAVATLCASLKSDSEQIRVRAAVALLNAVVPIREASDVEERLSALETVSTSEGTPT